MESFSVTLTYIYTLREQPVDRRLVAPSTGTAYTRASVEVTINVGRTHYFIQIRVSCMNSFTLHPAQQSIFLTVCIHVDRGVPFFFDYDGVGGCMQYFLRYSLHGGKLDLFLHTAFLIL